jgi:LytR cell envelope-related transcriptional attenuator
VPAIVQDAGALAGLAGLAGLTALLALHISQARDVRRLREWAGAEPGRPIDVRSAAAVLVGLLVLVGAAAGLTSHDAGNGAVKKPRRSVAAVRPGKVTVAVLNGTTVSGLAAALRERLAATGFRKGTIDVFTDQQLAKSVVQYAPGHQVAAKAVGRRLGISRRGPATAESRALAGDAAVIVIAGADKAP